MNLRPILPMIVLVGLGAVLSVSSQTPPISKGEFDRVIQAAYAKTATRHRREVTNAKKFQDGRVVEEELTTQDYAPPDKEHWLILARTFEKNTRIEIVYIGDIEYRREDKNPWKKSDLNDPKYEAQFTAATPAKTKSASTFTKEEKSADGMKLQVLTEKSDLNSARTSGVQTRRITLDAYGYIMSVEESVTEGSKENVVYTSRLSIVYSSHPINIEAPIK